MIKKNYLWYVKQVGPKICTNLEAKISNSLPEQLSVVGMSLEIVAQQNGTALCIGHVIIVVIHVYLEHSIVNIQYYII